MSRSTNRFIPGTAVYTCKCCGRKTRQTGGDGYMVGACDACFELSGYENEVEDGLASEWGKRSMQSIIDNVSVVYANGGQRVWDHLLNQVIKYSNLRIAEGQV